MTVIEKKYMIMMMMMMLMMMMNDALVDDFVPHDQCARQQKKWYKEYLGIPVDDQQHN